MTWSESDILRVLDACCDAFTFPMLDNGYVYLAATRLAAFLSAEDWHITVEIFGFSPRAGVPDLNVYNFGSNLQNRKTMDEFVTRDAYANYLRVNPNNESQFFYPIENGDWIEEEYGEMVSSTACEIKVRGQSLSIPNSDEYEGLGVALESPPEVSIFELCRAIASKHRDLVLATENERSLMVPENSRLIFLLDEWNHPDVVDPNSKPSGNETFQQIAKVLVEADPSLYSPTQPPNTHWSNWPDGGQL